MSPYSRMLSWLLLILMAPTAVAQTPSPTPTPTAEATATPTAEPTPLPTPPAPQLELLYTGESGGIGSGRYPLELLHRLLALGDAAPIASVNVIHGVLAQGPWLMIAEDGAVVTVARLAEGGALRCEPPKMTFGVLGRTETLISDVGSEPPWLSEVSPHAPVGELRVQRCKGPEGDVAQLIAPAGTPGEPEINLGAFEFRLAVRITTEGDEGPEHLTLVGLPVQEASRSFSRLKALKAERPAMIYADAGDWVDGASTVEPGQPSLHRGLRYDMLERLGPVALTPGYNELALGAWVFIEEQVGRDLPYIATNWRPEDDDLALEPWRVAEVPHERGTLRVAFVGLLDPHLVERLPKLKDEGVRIADPVLIMPEIIAELEALDPPPDLVVALTTAHSDVQEDIRRRVRGVDLLLGDSSLATYRVASSRTEVRPLARDAKGAALTLPLDGIGAAEVDYTFGGDLEAVTFTPHLVRSNLPVDPQVTAAITATRAQAYAALDHPLLTTPNPTAPFDVDNWQSLLCQAVLEDTQGDVVLLSPPPRPPAIPGMLTELYLLNQLPLLDSVERHKVPGYYLSDLLKKLYGTGIVACGTELGARSPTVRGRSVDSDRTYRVITTDHARRTTPLGALLDGMHSTRILDQPGLRPVTDPSGQAITLQQSMAAGLRAVRDQEGGPDQVTSTLLARAPTYKVPQWTLKVRQLSLEIERFRGTGNPAFEQIPETLAVSPSSFSLGSGSDVSIDYYSTGLYADARWRSSYTTMSIEGAELQETADDWEAASSVSIPLRTLPRETALRFMPYGELSLDSEFTPAEQEDGTLNPRQRDLYLTLGLSAVRWGPLRTLRVGAFANQDLARVESKTVEYGGRLVVETLHVFGPSLRLSTFGGVRVFGRTEDDDASDLRFKALAETRLSLPLSTWLDAAFFAQGFALKGRIPETDDLGFSWKLGFALDVRGALLL